MKKICPYCGSNNLRYAPVKGDYGTYDTKKFLCCGCFEEFPKEDAKQINDISVLDKTDITDE